MERWYTVIPAEFVFYTACSQHFSHKLLFILQTASSGVQCCRYLEKQPCMEVCTVAPLVCVHVLLLLTAVSEIPFARCGLDLWLAQETPDRPSSDLDSGTKGGGKKGCKEERRCGHREEKDSREVANKILKEGEKEVDGRGVKDMRVKKKKKKKKKELKGGEEKWDSEWLESRQTGGQSGVSKVAPWLAVRPRGSWQARLHATRRKPGVIVWHGTATGSGLWHRKEIQYRALTKLQPAWETGALKYSNNLACS